MKTRTDHSFEKRIVSYAPVSRRTWKYKRHAKYGLGILIAIAMIWLFGPRAVDRITLLNLESRCRRAKPGGSDIVFDESSDGRKLLPLDPHYTFATIDGMSVSGIVVWYSPDWEQFYARLSPPGRPRMATIYAGERRCAGGSTRIVVVEALRAAYGQLYLAATVIEPGSLIRPPRIVGGTISNLHFNDPVRLRIGHAETGREDGILICGDLLPDSAITLHVVLAADDSISISADKPIKSTTSTTK